MLACYALLRDGKCRKAHTDRIMQYIMASLDISQHLRTGSCLRNTHIWTTRNKLQRLGNSALPIRTRTVLAMRARRLGSKI